MAMAMLWERETVQRLALSWGRRKATASAPRWAYWLLVCSGEQMVVSARICSALLMVEWTAALMAALTGGLRALQKEQRMAVPMVYRTVDCSVRRSAGPMVAEKAGCLGRL